MAPKKLTSSRLSPAGAGGPPPIGLSRHPDAIRVTISVTIWSFSLTDSHESLAVSVLVMIRVALPRAAAGRAPGGAGPSSRVTLPRNLTEPDHSKFKSQVQVIGAAATGAAVKFIGSLRVRLRLRLADSESRVRGSLTRAPGASGTAGPGLPVVIMIIRVTSHASLSEPA